LNSSENVVLKHWHLLITNVSTASGAFRVDSSVLCN
jgi:hypothetical protein